MIDRTFEMLIERERILCTEIIDHRITVPFDKSSLNRICKPCFTRLFVLPKDKTVNENKNPLLRRSVRMLVQIDQLAVHNQPEETPFLQCREFFLQRVSFVFPHRERDKEFRPFRFLCNTVDDGMD